MDSLLDELEDIPLAITLAAPQLRYGIQGLLNDLKNQGLNPLKLLSIDDKEASVNDKIEEGKEQFNKAQALYRKINATYSQAVAFYDLAQILKTKKGYKGEAQELFRQAADLFDSINLSVYGDMCRGEM